MNQALPAYATWIQDCRAGNPVLRICSILVFLHWPWTQTSSWMRVIRKTREASTMAIRPWDWSLGTIARSTYCQIHLRQYKMPSWLLMNLSGVVRHNSFQVSLMKAILTKMNGLFRTCVPSLTNSANIVDRCYRRALNASASYRSSASATSRNHLPDILIPIVKHPTECFESIKNVEG